MIGVAKNIKTDNDYYFIYNFIVMLANKESETKDVKQKRSYSYGDLIKMQSNSAYTSMGNVIPSQKPSAARATFGLS